MYMYISLVHVLFLGKIVAIIFVKSYILHLFIVQFSKVKHLWKMRTLQLLVYAILNFYNNPHHHTSHPDIQVKTHNQDIETFLL